jgi:hypothetical protein
MPTRDPRDDKLEAMKAELAKVEDDIAAAKRQIQADDDIELDEVLLGDHGKGPGPDDDITPLVPPG